MHILVAIATERICVVTASMILLYHKQYDVNEYVCRILKYSPRTQCKTISHLPLQDTIVHRRLTYKIYCSDSQQ